MYKRINKDEIRAMLDNSKWSGGNEKFVIQTRDWLIVKALHSGHHVIIDDTNLDPKHEVRIRQLVKENDTTAGVRIMEFDIDLQEAIKRDAKRENSVGLKVITDMYFKYLYKPEKYVGPADKPEAIIVDIDGTLAKMNGRSPYDYSKVHTDLVNEPIAELVYYMNEPAGHKVIIVTGSLQFTDKPFGCTGPLVNEIKEMIDYHTEVVLIIRNQVGDLHARVHCFVCRLEYHIP